MADPVSAAADFNAPFNSHRGGGGPPRLNPHQRLKSFRSAWLRIKQEKAHLKEAKRRMFIYAAELLKKHTIPVINEVDITYVQRLWVECLWRGHVIFPTQPADFLIGGQAILTMEEVKSIMDQGNILPLTTGNGQQFDRDDLIGVHRELAIYGHWATDLDHHLANLRNLEREYCLAGVSLLNETCLPVVNGEDVSAVAMLRNAFGCAAVAVYPHDRVDFAAEYPGALPRDEIGRVEGVSDSTGMKRENLSIYDMMMQPSIGVAAGNWEENEELTKEFVLRL